MSHSSNLLVSVSTIYLIIILFFVVRLVIKYYDYQTLFKNIFKSIKSKAVKDIHILDLAELPKYILPKDDNKTLGQFYQILNDYARSKSDKELSEPLEYDNWYYNIILSLNESICRENIRTISIANDNDILKLLIPASSENIISGKTYLILWRALQQQLFYNKTELVYNYWAFAHEYIWIRLKPKWEEYDYSLNGLSVVLNKDEVEIRGAQINLFKEFHLLLCGYILYLKKYSLIKKIISYSQSKVYEFPLVPSTFEDIVGEFKNLSNKDFDQS